MCSRSSREHQRVVDRHRQLDVPKVAGADLAFQPTCGAPAREGRPVRPCSKQACRLHRIMGRYAAELTLPGLADFKEQVRLLTSSSLFSRAAEKFHAVTTGPPHSTSSMLYTMYVQQTTRGWSTGKWTQQNTMNEQLTCQIGLWVPWRCLPIREGWPCRPQNETRA